MHHNKDNDNCAAEVTAVTPDACKIGMAMPQQMSTSMMMVIALSCTKNDLTDLIVHLQSIHELHMPHQ